MPARARLSDFRYGKPPWIEAEFELQLENPAGAPVWFVLPFSHKGHPAAEAAVSELWVFSCDSQPELRYAAFYDGGARGFLLPAGGRLVLRRFPLLADAAVPFLYVTESPGLRVGDVEPAGQLKSAILCPQELVVEDARNWTVVEELKLAGTLQLEPCTQHRLLVRPIPEPK